MALGEDRTRQDRKYPLKGNKLGLCPALKATGQHMTVITDNLIVEPSLPCTTTRGEMLFGLVSFLPADVFHGLVRRDLLRTVI